MSAPISARITCAVRRATPGIVTWSDLGELHGDDVQAPGGRWYAPGARLVALAPNPQTGIMTSEPLTAVEIDHDSIVVRTANGREVTITGEGLDTEHLDYGYALTIHRVQGATYDRSPVLAAGGGRELGYVATSRASDHTFIHATANDLAQAVDDLQADWGGRPPPTLDHRHHRPTTSASSRDPAALSERAPRARSSPL